jgi:cytochrome o ubiquinol oxidase subunit II
VIKHLKKLIFVPALAALGGCNAVVLHPAGDVAAQQRDLLVESTVLMLVIIIPVMALTCLFAWRYRRNNASAHYEPEWDHSTELELVIWGAPLVIVICLGAMTWMGTHLLDPYRPVDRISANEALKPGGTPLDVDVVALDWKWLFIYPQYGIASVNQLDAPVDRPINFSITSATVMNSFFIPALAGQIYAMAGMQTELHAVINQVGTYEGFSANYSGAGFSGMRFKFHALQEADFSSWTAKTKAAGGDLTRAAYLALAKPSQNNPVQNYSAVDSGLFDAILNECVRPGQMCLNKMVAIDAQDQAGTKQAAADSAPLRSGKGRQAMVMPPMGASAPAEPSSASDANAGDKASYAPISGAGMRPPPFSGFFQSIANPPRLHVATQTPDADATR